MTTDTRRWAATIPAEPSSACPDGDCPSCRVMAAGARVLLAAAGATWEDLDRHAQEHYKMLAGDVMAAMSEALLDLGVVVPTAGEADR